MNMWEFRERCTGYAEKWEQFLQTWRKENARPSLVIYIGLRPFSVNMLGKNGHCSNWHDKEYTLSTLTGWLDVPPDDVLSTYRTKYLLFVH